MSWIRRLVCALFPLILVWNSEHSTFAEDQSKIIVPPAAFKMYDKLQEHTLANGLRVFLYGTVNYILYTAVMAKMYDLCPAGLDNPAHNVNGGIMPVKQRSGCYYPDFILRMIYLGFFHSMQIYNEWLLCILKLPPCKII